jgi:hypothetical protein
MKRVQFGRRMLRSREFSAERVGKLQDLRCRQDVRHVQNRRMQCHVRRRKQSTLGDCEETIDLQQS